MTKANKAAALEYVYVGHRKMAKKYAGLGAEMALRTAAGMEEGYLLVH